MQCACGSCKVPDGAPENTPWEVSTAGVTIDSDPDIAIRGFDVAVQGTFVNGYCPLCGDHCYGDGTVGLRRGIPAGQRIGG